MAEEGEPLLIADSNDHRLHKRNSHADQNNPAQHQFLQDESEVGVLEAINKAGNPFDEDDLFFMSTISETVSSALKNASLMFAERKLEILEALVRVSSEITSTIRLDRLLQIIVNSPQNALPFEFCAIALDNRGRLQLKAVSGMSSLPFGDARVGQLHELIRWLSSYDDAQHIRQLNESADGAQEERPPEVVSSSKATGYCPLFTPAGRRPESRRHFALREQ